MQTFNEYYEDKEHEQPLNEDVFTMTITSVLGIPLALGILWGATWVTKKYIAFSRKLILGIISNIKGVRGLVKKERVPVEQKVEKTIRKIEAAPEARKALSTIEDVQDKYYNELKELYKAIEDKDIDKAEELHAELTVNMQENPEVKVAIINTILQTYEEPPMYVSSPGNETYQVIKRLLGQKVARSMEELGKRGFNHYYKKVENEPV